MIGFAKRLEGAKFIVTTEIVKIMDEKIFVLYFFGRSDLLKKQLNARFRTFITKNDYITQVLNCEGVKWKTGAIAWLTEYLWSYGSGCTKKDIVIYKASDMLMLRFLTKKFIQSSDTTIWDAIDILQEKIKTEKLSRKHDKERRQIDEMMRMVGDLPDDFKSYIDQDVMGNSNYIIYSSNKRAAYCTGCKVNSPLDKELKMPNGYKVKHNEYGYCAHCGRHVRFKSEGMSRSMMLDEGWGIIIQSSGSNIITRYVHVFKDYRDDYRNPKFTHYELFRTIHTKGMKYEYEWATFKGKYEKRWCNIKDGQIHSLPHDVVLYEKKYQMYLKILTLDIA